MCRATTGGPAGPSTAHLFVRHPHAQAAEAYDGVEGGLQVGEGPLQRLPQPGQVAGGEAVAGGQGPGAAEEEQEAEGRPQVQPQACGETSALPRGPSRRPAGPTGRPGPLPTAGPRLTRRRHDAACATAPLPPCAPPRTAPLRHEGGTEGQRRLRGGTGPTGSGCCGRHRSYKKNGLQGPGGEA